MATRLTTNLKLRVGDNLTSDAVYNLERLDRQGAAFILTATDSLEIRSPGSITVTPNSAESGGSGVGGNLTVGASDQLLTLLQVFSSDTQHTGNFTVTGNTTLDNVRLRDGDGDYIEFSAPSLSGNLSLTFPGNLGASGQILSTDGSGNLSWISPAGGATLSSDWVPADGVSKTVVHNFGTQNIEVEVIDKKENVVIPVIDRIEFTSSNVITLTAVEAPVSPGYRVLLREHT